MPVVNQADVLPFAPLTIFFGANDSGKSSTLRVIAEQLYGMSRRHLNTDGSTVVVSFRNDEPALRAMLTEFRTQEKPTSPEAVWAFQTLEDHPQLFADSATGLAQMLAGAPVFALMTDLDVNGRRSEDGTLSVSLVISPSHMQELPPALQAALEILHDKRVRPFGRDPGIDPRQFGHPLRPWHLGPLGKTSLPLIPKPLSIPQGVDTALKALEDAVERSRRAFRAWSGSVGLALPDAGSANPWVDVEGKPDRFVVQLLGDLELLSHSLLPPFVRSTYRFDFDSTSPVKPPGVTRMNARMSAVYQLLQYETFAKKFRVDEIASGFQLWVEPQSGYGRRGRPRHGLAATPSVDAIIRSLDRPGSPAARFEALRKCWLDRDHGHAPWLCPPEERAWQLRMLIDASRDPRITPALDEVVHAVRPRLVLIDEPERHLSASVARDAARWLLRRAREGRSQFVIATHSPHLLSLPRGHDVRHVHVRRASNGLIHETFTPSDLKMLDAVANEMQLHHGELFGLVATIVWVEGPMDRAVLRTLRRCLAQTTSATSDVWRPRQHALDPRQSDCQASHPPLYRPGRRPKRRSARDCAGQPRHGDRGRAGGDATKRASSPRRRRRTDR